MEIAAIIWVGITTAVSALLASTITGIITYQVTKRQGHVQMAIHHENLQQQTDEARRERLTQARNPLLLEIRESASSTLAAYSGLATMTAIIQQQTDITPTAFTETKLKHFTETRLKHSEEWGEAQDRLFQLTPRISDKNLNTMVNAYLQAFQTATMTTEEMLSTPTAEQHLALDTAQKHLFDVNKRIEELLTGDHLT